MCRGLEGKNYTRCWVFLRGLVGLEEKVFVGVVEVVVEDKGVV